mgnify:FL=1
MKAFNKANDWFDLWLNKISENLDRISLRERIMVICATIIVVVAVIGVLLWKMHQAADLQQSRLTQLKDDLVWMQTNVATMKPADDLNLTTADKIQRVSQQQGMSVASQQMGDAMQIIAEHQNYSILANFLTQLAQMGLSIEKIELNKVGEQIKLTATVK